MRDSKTMKSQVKTYIKQMTEQEKLVLKIAESHLESSFDITKSIGFIEWKKNTEK